MASLAKNKPLKKRHVEFQPGTPVVNTEQPISQFICGSSSVEPLEPLDFPVREEDAAVLQSLVATGDISATCLGDTVSPILESHCEFTQKSTNSCRLASIQQPFSSIIRKCIVCPFFATTGRELKKHYRECLELGSSLQSTADEKVIDSFTKQPQTKNPKKKKTDGGGESKPELFECKNCEFYTRNLRAFTMHIRSHRSEDSATGMFRKQPCPKCGVLVFNLRNHAINQHARVDNGSKKYVCMTCSFVANTPRQLKQHNQAKHSSGSKVYRCKFCDKEYPYLPSLYRHQLKHSADKDRLYPRVCPTCRGRFRSKTALNEHIISRHSLQREFACEICSKRFATRNLLAQHKVVHVQKPAPGSNDAPSMFQKCETCGREFKRPADFRKHALTHTGEKPFVCRMGCEKRFSDASGRKRHERTHTGEKPYVCDKCGMRFVQSQGMRAHLKARHGDLPISATENQRSLSNSHLSAIQSSSDLKAHVTASNSPALMPTVLPPPPQQIQPMMQWPSCSTALDHNITRIGHPSSSVGVVVMLPSVDPMLHQQQHQLHHQYSADYETSNVAEFVGKITRTDSQLPTASSVPVTSSGVWTNVIPFQPFSGPCLQEQPLSHIPMSIHQHCSMVSSLVSPLIQQPQFYTTPVSLPEQHHHLQAKQLEPLMDMAVQSDPTTPTASVDNQPISLARSGSTHSAQALACDSGVLSVLEQLVADGRLQQCNLCTYIASSGDALNQHIHSQHANSVL